MLERIKQEPALSLGVIQALVALVVAFGVDLTAEQVGVVVAFSAAVLSWITRSQVSPVGKDDDDV